MNISRLFANYAYAIIIIHAVDISVFSTRIWNTSYHQTCNNHNKMEHPYIIHILVVHFVLLYISTYLTALINLGINTPCFNIPFF